MYRARAERDRGGEYFFDVQRIHGQGDSYDIDDGIDRADLVKMNLFYRDVVDFCFGNADFFEYGQAKPDDPLVKSGAMDQLNDFGIMSVMRRRRIRIQHHVHFQSGDPFLVHALPIEREKLDRNFAQLLLDIIAIRSRVHKGRQGHIAANAGKAVQISYSHRESLFNVVL